MSDARLRTPFPTRSGRGYRGRRAALRRARSGRPAAARRSTYTSSTALCGPRRAFRSSKTARPRRRRGSRPRHPAPLRPRRSSPPIRPRCRAAVRSTSLPKVQARKTQGVKGRRALASPQLRVRSTTAKPRLPRLRSRTTAPATCGSGRYPADPHEPAALYRPLSSESAAHRPRHRRENRRTARRAQTHQVKIAADAYDARIPSFSVQSRTAADASAQRLEREVDVLNRRAVEESVHQTPHAAFAVVAALAVRVHRRR